MDPSYATHVKGVYYFFVLEFTERAHGCVLDQSTHYRKYTEHIATPEVNAEKKKKPTSHQ